jgi:hypothetical protein
MACLIVSVIYCVFDVLYQVSDGTGTNITCNNDGVYILDRNNLSTEQKLTQMPPTVLCSGCTYG